MTDHGGQTDLYYDPKTGIIYQKPKGGKGYGEPVGWNINELWSNGNAPITRSPMSSPEWSTAVPTHPVSPLTATTIPAANSVVTQNNINKGTAIVVGGIVAWELLKWTVAITTAPATAGASVAIALSTP